MAQKVGPKEKLILQVVDKLPFAEDDRKAWHEIIQSSGANEELMKDILEKYSHLAAEGETETALIVRNTAELHRLIQSWRLEQNLGNLPGRRRR